MKKDETSVLINLLAIAKYDRAPDYPIQFMTRGTLSMEESGNAVLAYNETQQDEETGEMTTAQITLSLEKNRVTMTRMGEYSNTMVFVPDRRFEGTYHTPFGNMDMAVYARGVQCNIGREKGSVHLKYQLDLQGAYASSNELHLEYTASGKEKAQ
ncbi:MAG: DUF1934 domain-containing protein [Clostridia bacterium]|nr:DUF1934 domain-containing protein [Clostridia bacterium]